MNWECPKDWAHMPETKPASDGMLMRMIFDGNDRWRQIRNPWFVRCNASGNWIWPGQMMWVGVVTYDTPDIGLLNCPGSYSTACLNNDQYIIQKLKGVI